MVGSGVGGFGGWTDTGWVGLRGECDPKLHHTGRKYKTRHFDNIFLRMDKERKSLFSYFEGPTGPLQVITDIKSPDNVFYPIWPLKSDFISRVLCLGGGLSSLSYSERLVTNFNEAVS